MINNNVCLNSIIKLYEGFQTTPFINRYYNDLKIIICLCDLKITRYIPEM